MILLRFLAGAGDINDEIESGVMPAKWYINTTNAPSV
jgi:hypothetical protein